MKFFNLFANRQPYLDADDGTDIGGGSDANDVADFNTDSNSNTEDSLFDLDDSTGDTADTDNDDSTNVDTDTDVNNADVNQQKQDEQKYKVKYNGEEVELTLDELLTNSQKGLNYDKVLSQKQALENSEEFKVLDYYAQQAGMTRQDYTKYLGELKESQALQNEVANVKSKYADLPDELAEEMAQIRLNQNKSELVRKQENEAKQKQEAKQQEISDFLNEYPDIKPEQIPIEVWDMVNKGKSLLTAYTKWDNQQLKLEIQAIKQNNKNKSKTTGSVSGDASNNDDDSFLKGLFK